MEGEGRGNRGVSWLSSDSNCEERRQKMEKAEEMGGVSRLQLCFLILKSILSLHFGEANSF